TRSSRRPRPSTRCATPTPRRSSRKAGTSRRSARDSGTPTPRSPRRSTCTPSTTRGETRIGCGGSDSCMRIALPGRGGEVDTDGRPHRGENAHMLRSLVVALFAVLVLVPVARAGNTFYAVPLTVNTTTCDQVTPCTLEAAIGKAVDGDVVQLAPGDYHRG